jgi:protein TonB
LPQSRTDAADGKDSPSATANDGTVAPTEIAAHRGGTKGAAPRGDNPKPEYPFIARKRGYQGRVVLRVDVLPNGTADSVELESSSGYDSLDAAAVRTVRQWRFVPARRSGKPVAAAVTVPVLFKLY